MVDVGRAALREGILILDGNIAAFFKASADDPQAKMNAGLREYVEAHQRTA